MRFPTSALFLLVLALLSLTLSSQTPAFPGAGGGGMYTTGGRGGKVLYVTSLADDGSTGTLRWAVNQSGARTILFKVSGTIALKSALKISNGNLTIAGQSAPGDGICIRDYEVNIKADNVIIRFLRFRLGNKVLSNESDAIWGRYQNNIIIDHCSMSWSIDECASFYSNNNFTLQWCYLTESLNNAGHSKGAHGYGGIWGGKNASFHHNLLAHHNSRNPRFNGWKRSGLSYENPLDEERVDFRNNVIYNWGDNSSYGGEALGKYNIVNNYFKYGPGTKSSIKYKITQVDKDGSSSYAPGYGKYFIEDNYVYGNQSVTNNNWSGVTYASGVNQAGVKVNAAFDAYPIAEHAATVAFEKVLDYGGCSLARDAVDTRIANEARNGTATYSGSVTKRAGIIDKPEDVGGYPTYQSSAAPADTDGDGIPDGWLDAHYPGKTAKNLNEEGYTYLEVYLNSLVGHIVEAHDAETLLASVDEVNDKHQINIAIHQNQLKIASQQLIKDVLIYDIYGRLITASDVNDYHYDSSISQQTYPLAIVRVSLQNGDVITEKVKL